MTLSVFLFSEIPSVDEFKVSVGNIEFIQTTQIAWLENKIYFLHEQLSKVFVFADRAPFEELKETVEITGMIWPYILTASAASRSILIGDYWRCVWQVQMPKKEVTEWEINGIPTDLSITPANELLVVVTNLDHSVGFTFCLNIINLTDASRKMIDMPRGIQQITCAAQLLDGNFIISYSYTRFSIVEFLISIISDDGKTFIRTLDPSLFPSIRNTHLHSYLSIAVLDDRHVFVIDISGKIVCLNLQFTDCLAITNKDDVVSNPQSFFYVEEKRQLLVSGIKGAPGMCFPVVSLFHLQCRLRY